MTDQHDARWLAEHESHCQNAFGISAEEFARQWRTGEYGPIEELEVSGNWQDALIVRLGRSLDGADGEQTSH